MEKMKRKSMGYSKKKLVCSNCDDILRDKTLEIYSCNKMEEHNNWILPYGSCHFHSAKELENIVKSARSGLSLKKEDVEKRERIILNKLVRSIFEEER